MAAHPTSPAPSPHTSKQARSSSPSQHVPLAETPVQRENQHKYRFPPVIVRDFVGLPPPPLLYRPIYEEWVIDLKLPPSAVPGIRKRKEKEWEVSHGHLYRSGGNRADPPNTIPKTWGGFPKTEDDERMRRAQARFEEAINRPLPLGLTPTEPDLGVIFKNYSAMTDDEREANNRVNEIIRKKFEMAPTPSHEPLIDTPPTTPLPLDTLHLLKRNHALIYVPSSPPATPRTPSPIRTSEERTKRKREGSDNERVHSNAASSNKRRLRRSRYETQDGHEAATGTTSCYWLRRRTPSSRTPSTKHAGSRKGKKS